MRASDFGKFSGSLTADVLEFHPDAIPTPDTLCIHMTRGERRIADELRMAFGCFERVIIDVDGERHEFGADSLIRLLECYEGASRWHDLFGTPERAARTLRSFCKDCFCGDCVTCGVPGWADYSHDYGALLDWLKGEGE